MAAAAAERPFPPGSYPVVVVGSGPGGLQVSYFLRRLKVDHAVLSADSNCGGMFCRFPLCQRLVTWSKPYAPAERGTRPYEWYDWNSPLADEPSLRALVPQFMDGASIFPSRAEMERGWTAFAERAQLRVRFECRWLGTAHEDGRFTLKTSDGDFQARCIVFAVGAAQPWKPAIPGLEAAPHYAQTHPFGEYAGKRIFIVGKGNSAFELADTFHPLARQIILASPSPLVTALHGSHPASTRARYIVPYEDHVLGGGTFVLDAAIERIERRQTFYRVTAQGTTVPGRVVLDVDEVIAATGFCGPLGDLRELGVATFSQDRFPSLTPFWESDSLPGVYFAGALSLGAPGLRKHGIPSLSGGVAGFRHNARILATHIASRLGASVSRPRLEPDAVVPYLLDEATRAPELWNQRGYLARVITFEPSEGIFDDGILPLQHFLDTTGADGVAISVETDPQGAHRPVAYLRRRGRISEHVLAGDLLLNFHTEHHDKELRELLSPILGK